MHRHSSLNVNRCESVTRKTEPANADRGCTKESCSDNTHFRTILTCVVPISCEHSRNTPACTALWLPCREITPTREPSGHANVRSAATLRTYKKRMQGMRNRAESVTRLSRLHCETIRMKQTFDTMQTLAVEQDAKTRATSARARSSAVRR